MIEDVSADLVTDKTHLLIQPRAIVGLSHWLLRTYAQANRNDKVLAVVTRPDSVLTLAAARFINDARACWIVDHPDGAYDGFSGLRASWDGVSFKLGGGIHPAYFEVAVGDERALSINAEILHGYHDNPQLGPFSLQILAAAGCAPPVRFGAIEPLYEVFSPTIVTEHARSFSPEEAIAIVELERFTGFRPKKLSGGLLRRLNIACGIAHAPELIILDEPTVAVDPQSRNAILEGIRRLNERGATIVYTSHYMEEVEQLCHQIVIMDAGRQVASGTADELKAMIGTGERIRAEIIAPVPLGEAALEHVRRLEHVRTASYQAPELVVECSPGAHNLSDVLGALTRAGVTCGRITSEPPTLNDVFLEITGRALRDEAA